MDKVELSGGNLVHSLASETPEMPPNIPRAHSSHNLFKLLLLPLFFKGWQGKTDVGPGLMPAGKAGDRGACLMPVLSEGLLSWVPALVQ